VKPFPFALAFCLTPLVILLHECGHYRSTISRDIMTFQGCQDTRKRVKDTGHVRSCRTTPPSREARNLTVQQVVEITKIRTDHLRALEEGNFDVFSAPVYIRGFVRTYSILLKLDVPQIMAALEAELAQTTKFAEPPPLAEHPHGVDFLHAAAFKGGLAKGSDRLAWHRSGGGPFGLAVLAPS